MAPGSRSPGPKARKGGGRNEPAPKRVGPFLRPRPRPRLPILLLDSPAALCIIPASSVSVMRAASSLRSSVGRASDS